MSESCDQGNNITKNMQDFILGVQRDMADDRLKHQESMGKLTTKLELQSEKVSNLIDTSVSEIKACKTSRSSLHRRINKIWTTGVGTLIMIIGWLAKEFMSKHPH